MKNQNILSANDLITYLALLAVSAQRALPKINQAYCMDKYFCYEAKFNRCKRITLIIKKKFTILIKILSLKIRLHLKMLVFHILKMAKKINNLNLVIKKGEKIVIRGDSGSEKVLF